MCSNSQAIKGVLWDLDGVIVDTHQDHILAMQQALASEGFSATKEELMHLFGTNTEKIAASVLKDKATSELIQAVKQKHSAFFCTNIRGRVQTFAGVIETLRRFACSGLSQAIASSSTEDIILTVLDELDIRSFFQSIQSGADLPPKPDAAVFLAAACSLQLEPEQCLVIEDSPMGIHGAKVAAMRCLAVTNSRRRAELSEADWVVDRLDLWDGSEAVG